MILVERKKREHYVPSTDAEGETIGRIASRHVERGSHIHTDGFPSYTVLQSLGFEHEWVNHSMGEYARGDVHVNNCENRASLLKPWLAVYRGISKDNLGIYLSLFRFQRTTSQIPSLQRLKLIVKA
jgi:transposase-like protein